MRKGSKEMNQIPICNLKTMHLCIHASMHLKLELFILAKFDVVSVFPAKVDVFNLFIKGFDLRQD